MNSTKYETGSMQQLTSDELESVGGGLWPAIGAVVAVAAVGVAAYTAFSWKAERSGKNRAIRDNAMHPCSN